MFRIADREAFVIFYLTIYSIRLYLLLVNELFFIGDNKFLYKNKNMIKIKGNKMTMSIYFLEA